MKTINIIIAGSRNIVDRKYIFNKIRYYLQNYEQQNINIISGNAKGIDKLGEEYAKSNNINCDIYPANWDKYGKSAGYKRNIIMADKANALLAFWDGESKGTKHMIDTAINKKLKVKIVEVTHI